MSHPRPRDPVPWCLPRYGWLKSGRPTLCQARAPPVRWRAPFAPAIPVSPLPCPCLGAWSSAPPTRDRAPTRTQAARPPSGARMVRGGRVLIPPRRPWRARELWCEQGPRFAAPGLRSSPRVSARRPAACYLSGAFWQAAASSLQPCGRGVLSHPRHSCASLCGSLPVRQPRSSVPSPCPWCAPMAPHEACAFLCRPLGCALPPRAARGLVPRGMSVWRRRAAAWHAPARAPRASPGADASDSARPPQPNLSPARAARRRYRVLRARPRPGAPCSRALRTLGGTWVPQSPTLRWSLVSRHHTDSRPSRARRHTGCCGAASRGGRHLGSEDVFRCTRLPPPQGALLPPVRSAAIHGCAKERPPVARSACAGAKAVQNTVAPRPRGLERPVVEFQRLAHCHTWEAFAGRPNNRRRASAEHTKHRCLKPPALSVPACLPPTGIQGALRASGAHYALCAHFNAGNFKNPQHLMRAIAHAPFDAGLIGIHALWRAGSSSAVRWAVLTAHRRQGTAVCREPAQSRKCKAPAFAPSSRSTLPSLIAWCGNPPKHTSKDSSSSLSW